ncbi:MAG: CDP-alcohol phosphatidyltransferase [Paludibacter sp.]|nr:CDP-alcohol phosphatidyltransferase [Paludibacter sp.]
MENAIYQSNNDVVKIIAEGRNRTNVFKVPEQKFIAYLVQRIPNWLSSDMLTAIGFSGSIITFVSFLLAFYVEPTFLLLGVLGFFVSWFGDSLDGRIAYFRQKPRKWYGYSLDITVDWLGIILMGLGFVVYVDGVWEFVGIAFVVLYGWEMITTTVKYKITGKYSIDSGLFGPTEVRIILSIIFIIEVVFHDSILYVSTLATFLLFISNIISTKKLLKLADEIDKSERNINI